jgi:two-component system response regulator TctD
MHFLIVEDTADVASAIASRMESAGHACDIAPTVADAELYLMANDYDAVILDINLPDGSGTGILRNIRTAGNPVPVLVLTARFAIDDKIDMLDIGADDYMVKPFDLGELEARVRAIVRRRGGETKGRISAGNLVFDMSSRTAAIAGKLCDLTRREAALLEILLTNRGRVLEKETLVIRLFGGETEVNSNAVELYVGRLRRKIEGSGFRIRTLRGLGYQGVDDGDI